MADPAPYLFGLTPKQAAFVAAYLEGATGADAAKRAGYSPKSASRQAWKLLHRTEDVRTAVAAGFKDMQDKHELTRDDNIAHFTRLERAAEEAEQFNAAVRAREAIAKLMGQWPDSRGVVINTENVTIGHEDALRAALESARSHERRLADPADPD